MWTYFFPLGCLLRLCTICDTAEDIFNIFNTFSFSLDMDLYKCSRWQLLFLPLSCLLGKASGRYGLESRTCPHHSDCGQLLSISDPCQQSDDNFFFYFKGLLKESNEVTSVEHLTNAWH